MSWLGEAGSEAETEEIGAVAGCQHGLVQGVKTVCQQSEWQPCDDFAGILGVRTKKRAYMCWSAKGSGSRG
jgi:hypothetical protein